MKYIETVHENGITLYKNIIFYPKKKFYAALLYY